MNTLFEASLAAGVCPESGYNQNLEKYSHIDRGRESRENISKRKHKKKLYIGAKVRDKAMPYQALAYAGSNPSILTVPEARLFMRGIGYFLFALLA